MGDEMRREIQMSVSCHDCVRRSTPDCDDCLVSYVLGESPDQLTMTSDEVVMTEMLTSEGLIPRLRFVSQSTDL
ncbi:MAG: hypothetical protein KJS64_04765 [Acidobacteria bacterium]|nr:hypothetical protein [Acidobacteriota bacterium]